MTIATKQFAKLYNAIATRQNYIEPKYPSRMDNWSVDRYETGNWFAGMSDAGWYKYVGFRDAAGKVLWRVSEDGTKNEYNFDGITEEDFLNIEWK